MAVWNGEELLRAAAVCLAWASVVSLWIAWDAHVKFRLLLDTPRPDEWDMSPVWERRSHRWRGIGLVTSDLSILSFAALRPARMEASSGRPHLVLVAPGSRLMGGAHLNIDPPDMAPNGSNPRPKPHRPRNVFIAQESILNIQGGISPGRQISTAHDEICRVERQLTGRNTSPKAGGAESSA